MEKTMPSRSLPEIGSLALNGVNSLEKRNGAAKPMQSELLTI